MLDDLIAVGSFSRMTGEKIRSPGTGGTEFLLLPENLKVMEKQQIKGSWNEFKGKIKQKYADLTDDDLMYEEGQEDEFFGRLQKKLGKTKDQIKQEIDKL